MFANFRPSVSNFWKFFSITRTIFFTVGQNNFWNKIPWVLHQKIGKILRDYWIVDLFFGRQNFVNIFLLFNFCDWYFERLFTSYLYFRKYDQGNKNYKSCFTLLFSLRPGTLQASKLSFALIQFHLNEFENMMLLILEQLLLKLFSINKVVLTKNLFNKFWVEHNKEIVMGNDFIKKPVARKTNFFLRKNKTKKTFSLKGYPKAAPKSCQKAVQDQYDIYWP